MKVAVLIMSTLEEPSTTNCKGMLETFIKYTQDNKDTLNHKYDFYFYYADREKFKDDPKLISHLVPIENNVYHVYCNLQESIYRTYEKTIFTFNAVNNYDWYIRINISNFINIKLLDIVLEKLDTSIIYCNSINTIISDENYINEIYPRGDFYIMSSLVKTAILPEANKLLFSDITLDYNKRCNVIHVDDCLLGVALIKTFGNKYQDMMRIIKYNFIPRNDINEFNPFAISSRVKTIPPQLSYSGYSWEDNEYRRKDYDKMKLLYNKMNSIEYGDVAIEDILVDETNGKTAILVQYLEAQVATLKQYLKNKKRG